MERPHGRSTRTHPGGAQGAVDRRVADNRTLAERLKAARSNLRYQDRRVADLEARTADPGTDLVLSSRGPCMSVLRAILVPRRRPGAAARGERHG